MGGNSTKQSSEIERNRRLREFEEELVERPDSPTHIPREHYFSSHFGEEEEEEEKEVEVRAPDLEIKGQGQGPVVGRKGSAVSCASSLTRILQETEEEEKEKDKEVEDAIAELEETFRAISPPPYPSFQPDRESAKGRNHDLNVNNREFNRSRSCGPLNIGPPVTPGRTGTGQNAQDRERERERRGTPIAMTQTQAQGYVRHTTSRRPLGLSHFSRSSGGLAVGGAGSGSPMDVKGVLSAPPMNSREPQVKWEPVSFCRKLHKNLTVILILCNFSAPNRRVRRRKVSSSKYSQHSRSHRNTCSSSIIQQ